MTDCNVCEGIGAIECFECAGTGIDMGADCVDDEAECEYCCGEGELECGDCYGTGEDEESE